MESDGYSGKGFPAWARGGPAEKEVSTGAGGSGCELDTALAGSTLCEGRSQGNGPADMPQCTSAETCRICGSGELRVFHEMSQVPVHVGVLWPTASEAKHCARGDVALAYCSTCGFISNIAFDSRLVDYERSYDNALHFSPYFQEYERSLACRLIERYDIRNRTVLEIGCGNGHFLGLLCELGNNRGLGFDPSYDPRRVDPRAIGKVEFFQRYYSDESSGHQADLICCRHVLEHVEQPAEFVRMIRRSLVNRPSTVLYFEVPNARLILERMSIWDIVYEHCGYFTVESLGYLFEVNGFTVNDIAETYDRQFLGMEVSPGMPAREGTAPRDAGGPDLSSCVERFPQRFAEKRNDWRARLGELNSLGECAVIWGAGAKTVGFINMLQIDDEIRYIVDVNPRKQGTFLSGRGHMIVSPEALKEIRPDTVVVANAVYVREIVDSLNGMGVSPRVVAL